MQASTTPSPNGLPGLFGASNSAGGSSSSPSLTVSRSPSKLGDLPFVFGGFPAPSPSNSSKSLKKTPAVSLFSNSSTTRNSNGAILLPIADPDKHEKCCEIGHAEAYLDHAKDFHTFSLTRLAWAIQNKAGAAAIERHLDGFAPAKIKTYLSPTVNGFPILFYAAEQNSPELVRVLCKAGAVLGDRSELTGLPLLAYTVLSAEYDLTDTTDTFIALLAEGAWPEQLPIDMWEAPLNSPRADTPKAAHVVGCYGWCVPELRKALARNLTFMQRYLLWRAKHLARSTPRMVQIATAFSILPLLETPYHIIGQTPAIKQVIDAVASHYMFDSGFPLVMLFTGASGHGKTEVAMRMGNLLSLDIHMVDCTEMKYETDVFGPKAPYVGYQVGSKLNNFLAEHSGQRAVVFLDEFEKTTNDVHKSLLLPFESGTYHDRRDQKKLDCTKIIWILAANLGEEVIQKFWSTSARGLGESQQLHIDSDKLSTLLEGIAIKTFGAPLTGRLSYTIPFLPFTDLERAVATYKFMREFKNEIRKPVNVEAKLFPRRLILNYTNDGQLAQHLAKQYYSHELGARSLQKAVHRHIKQKLAHAFLNEITEIYDKLNVEPMATYEAKLTTQTLSVDEVTVERRGNSSTQQRNCPAPESPL